MKITNKIIQQILLWTELKFKQVSDYIMKLQTWQEQPFHDTLILSKIKFKMELTHDTKIQVPIKVSSLDKLTT